MTVFEGSRYETAAVIRTADSDGVVRPALYSMVAANPSLSSHTTHVVEEGDRFDLLAHALFGDPEMWWAIADLNPEVLYPSRLSPGIVIRLPVA